MEEHNLEVYQRCMKAVRTETRELGAPKESTIKVMCNVAWFSMHQYYPETERIVAGLVKSELAIMAAELSGAPDTVEAI